MFLDHVVEGFPFYNQSASCSLVYDPNLVKRGYTKPLKYGKMLGIGIVIY